MWDPYTKLQLLRGFATDLTRKVQVDSPVVVVVVAAAVVAAVVVAVAAEATAGEGLLGVPLVVVPLGGRLCPGLALGLPEPGEIVPVSVLK